MKVIYTLFVYLSAVAVVRASFRPAGGQPIALNSGNQASKRAEGNISAFTNAERFKRGLPPLPPSRRAVNRFLHGPHQPRASNSLCPPLLTATGRIRIDNLSTNLPIGYLKNAFSTPSPSSKTFGIGTLAESMKVSLPSINPFDEHFDILSINGPAPGHPYVGVVYPGTVNFGPGVFTYAFVAGTDQTASGAPPQSVGHTLKPPENYPAESAIWSIGCVVPRIYANWVNPGGDLVPASIVYLATSNLLDITGDVAVFKSNTFGWVEVSFTFEYYVDDD